MTRIGGTPRQDGPRATPPAQVNSQQPRPETTALTSCCGVTRKPFVLNLTKIDGQWAVTGSQTVQQAPDGAGSGEVLRTIPPFADTYPGCPHCRHSGVVACGACSAMTCWDGQAPTMVCSACDTNLTLGQADVSLKVQPWQ